MGRIMVVKQVCELNSGGVLILLGFLGGWNYMGCFTGVEKDGDKVGVSEPRLNEEFGKKKPLELELFSVVEKKCVGWDGKFWCKRRWIWELC